jgi:GNAT superfamily N-acetyltransferase
MYRGADYIFDVLLGNDRIAHVVVHHFGSGMSYMRNLAYIEVLEPFRRKGYGSEILKQLVERFGQLALFAKPAVHEFYIKNGFRVIPSAQASNCISEWRLPPSVKVYGDLMINGKSFLD